MTDAEFLRWIIDWIPFVPGGFDDGEHYVDRLRRIADELEASREGDVDSNGGCLHASD